MTFGFALSLLVASLWELYMSFFLLYLLWQFSGHNRKDTEVVDQILGKPVAVLVYIQNKKMVEMTEQIAQIELKEKMRRSLLERANMNEHIHSMQL